MITVGYGDIVPSNNSEKITCIFIMLIACGVYAYSFNIIGSIIQDYFKRDQELDQKLEIINKFMTKKKIN